MSKYRYREKKKKGSKKGKVIAIIIAVCAAAGAAGGFIYHRYFVESKERLAGTDYYKVEDLTDTQGLIIVNGEINEQRAYMLNGGAYLPMGFVNDELNDRFYFDKETQGVLYTNGKGTVELIPGADGYTDETGTAVKTQRAPLIKEGEDFYLDSEFIEKYTPMSSAVHTEPSRVAISFGKHGWRGAHTVSDCVVRYYAGIKSKIVTDVAEGSALMILDTEGEWTKVYTEDGFTGYVKSSALSEDSVIESAPEDMDTYTHLSMDTPVTISWMSIDNSVANQNVSQYLTGVQGLDVIAPTWYSFGDSKGTINDFSSAEVVEDLHNKGFKIWPVVKDFQNDVDIEVLLSSKAMRKRMIERLMSDASYMKYDGINVDFETITNDSSDDFLQFVRELSVECRKNQIILSIDDYPPRGYNSYYDMEEQAQYVDYVVIMNYDEHYSGSDEAGSVSSIGYVKSNIELALGHVPKERLINALPFYTRIFGTDKDKKIVANKALTMTEVAKMISENNAKIEWSENDGQNVASYTKDNTDYVIWIEDAKSMKLKLDATKERDLAGVAFWRMGQETSDIWGLISEYKR